MNRESSILYVVASPIGNLADITLRALETIKTCDLIVAEDTRVTAKLLNHYQISKPMRSIRERSGEDAIASLVSEMARGRLGSSVVYMSDAGTPGVSDPGGRLVQAARASGIPVVPLPGASALSTIMQISGINLAEGVTFLGFLPKKKGRKTLFKKFATNPLPVIIFENKYRLIKTLQDFESVWGEKSQVVVGRELTKKFEEITTGDISTIIKNLTQKPPRGEFTVLICPPR